MIIIFYMHLNVMLVKRVSTIIERRLKKKFNAQHFLGITPLSDSEETVRVVSMDKDYHVDCYKCEACQMQLTDEPDKRCYPLDGHLLCRNCHFQRINTHSRMIEPASISYQFMN